MEDKEEKIYYVDCTTGNFARIIARKKTLNKAEEIATKKYEKLKKRGKDGIVTIFTPDNSRGMPMQKIIKGYDTKDDIVNN